MIYKIYDEENRMSDELVETVKMATEISLENELGDVYDPELSIEISLSIVGADEMYEINSGFRGVDSVTDVLSFPQYADAEDLIEDLEFFAEEETDDSEIIDESGFESTREFLLGDVVICYDRAVEQAEEFGHSFEREFVYLYVHSMMHLLGYDHMEDDERAVMREHEEAVMSRLGITRD